MEMLISFSSRTTLPKVPKAGSMTMVLLCLIGQQIRLTWSRGRWGEEDFFYLSHTRLYREYITSEMYSLHLTHPKWTHTRSSGQPCYGARGAVGGSVPCSRTPQLWYWRRRERWLFTPPSPHQTQQCRWAEGHCQRNLGFHTTSAVPQTDHLHATPNWGSN